jgi:hypothetical protein
MKHSIDEHKFMFGVMSVPAKALATCIILAMAFGMLGAAGQIIVHDIIPTFYSDSPTSAISEVDSHHGNMTTEVMESNSSSDRGDLFSSLSPIVTESEDKPFYTDEQFVWTLRWSHIHLFGMGIIFIFMGAISLLLDASPNLRTWLIVMPFVGVLIDIAAMWLKAFVSPIFFWLHFPGGGLFGLIFVYVSLRALWEMWIKPHPQDS